MTVISKISEIGDIDIDIDIDIDSITDDLMVIADWRDSLLARIERTKLIFQFHDSSTDIEPLIQEVAAFKRVAACLGYRS